MSQGSVWSEAENHNAAPVIVINQTFARQYFPAGDAIGHAIKMPLPDSPPYNLAASTSSGWLRIVGIIVDKRDDGLHNPIKPEAFVPYTLWMRMGTQILVKSSVPPLTLMPAIRKQIAAVDADQQAQADPQDLEHWIMNQPEYASIQFISWLFGIFAALALVLAAVGLYSVVSYSVVQRTNEFGIRMALGAQREHVLHIVFRSALGSVGSGVVIGLVLALVLNRILVKVAAEGSWGDATVIVCSTAVLCIVALLACAIPARRASRVDPMVALRYE